MIQAIIETLKRKNTCPGCGENWLQLELDMKEPGELTVFGVGGSEFIWQRSFNHQRAVELIDKCSVCQEHFRGGN